MIMDRCHYYFLVVFFFGVVFNRFVNVFISYIFSLQFYTNKRLSFFLFFFYLFRFLLFFVFLNAFEKQQLIKPLDEVDQELTLLPIEVINISFPLLFSQVLTSPLSYTYTFFYDVMKRKKKQEKCYSHISMYACDTSTPLDQAVGTGLPFFLAMLALEEIITGLQVLTFNLILL